MHSQQSKKQKQADSKDIQLCEKETVELFDFLCVWGLCFSMKKISAKDQKNEEGRKRNGREKGQRERGTYCARFD